LSGAGLCDTAGVAILAAVMTHLQVERAITEVGATLDAKATPGTERLLYGVFEIRGLDKLPDNRACGTDLIFSGLIESRGIGFEVTEAEFAITTHGIAMGAFDSRGLKNACGFALAALDALTRIQLPDLPAGTIKSGGTINDGSHDRGCTCPQQPRQEISTCC
jgi:hypothetical protein